MPARKYRATYEDAQELASTLLQVLRSLGGHPDVTDNKPLLSEFRTVINLAETIDEKLPKMQRLQQFRGYKFATLENGIPKVLSDPEAIRSIMGYMTGDVLSIIKKWDIDENGNWIPREDPSKPVQRRNPPA